LSLSTPGRHIGGRQVLFHLFLTSALHGDAVNFMPWPLYPQKEPQCPLNRRRLGELRSQSGRSGDKKNFLFLPGFDLQIIQSVVSRSINYSILVPGMPFPQKCSSSSSCKYRFGCCCCFCCCCSKRRCCSCKCRRRRCCC